MERARVEAKRVKNREAAAKSRAKKKKQTEALEKKGKNSKMDILTSPLFSRNTSCSDDRSDGGGGAASRSSKCLARNPR